MCIHTALIIGDTSPMYAHISRLLQQHDCQCIIALDGSLSTDRLTTLKPDFVILDLPIRSSPSLQTIKNIGEALKQFHTTILITAPSFLLQRSDLQFAHIHLAKPCSVQQAETAVLKLLNTNRISA